MANGSIRYPRGFMISSADSPSRNEVLSQGDESLCNLMLAVQKREITIEGFEFWDRTLRLAKALIGDLNSFTAAQYNNPYLNRHAWGFWQDQMEAIHKQTTMKFDHFVWLDIMEEDPIRSKDHVARVKDAYAAKALLAKLSLCANGTIGNQYTQWLFTPDGVYGIYRALLVMFGPKRSGQDRLPMKGEFVIPARLGSGLTDLVS